jgi:Flp pilus assembly protein TadG
LRFAFSGLRANRVASTTTEFALLVPLMSMLLLGTVEFGSLIYGYSAMQMGTAVAARRLAVNLATPAQAQAAGLQIVPGWARPHVTATVTQTNSADPGNNVISVRMVATSDDVGAVALISRLAPLTLTAQTTVKQELPYVD